MQATLIASLGQRITSLFRLLAMTTLFTLVGAICISAWQTYGEAGRQAIAERVSRLAPVISPRPDQAAAMSAPSMPVTPSAERADGVGSTAIVSGETAQLLQSLARDVAAMGQDMAELKERVGRLAASQDAMARDVARIRQPNPRSDVRSAMAAVPSQIPAAAPDARKPTSLLPPSIPRPR
jgi:hypothetical protein